MIKSPLKKQIIKFTFVGAVAALADLSFYYLFLQILPEHIIATFSNESIAKALSFVIGTTVTYYLNKFWTWRRKGRSTKGFLKFLALYACSLTMNVAVNALLLYLLHNFAALGDLPNKYLIAFIGAAGASAVVNFIGQKFWVFKTEEKVQQAI
jgi:putative flippase GtrA